MSKLICYLDTETTGLNPEKDQIIELAMIVHRGIDPTTPFHEDNIILHGVEDARHLWRFRPTVDIAPDATAAHGITIDMLLEEPVFPNVADKLIPICNEIDIIVGYNVDFDLQMLSFEFERAGYAWPFAPDVVVFDVHKLWKFLEPRSLGTAHRRFVGRELEGAHSALADVVGTKDVLFGMLEFFAVGETDWFSLAEKTDPERKNRFGFTHHLKWVEADGNRRLTFTFGKNDGVAVWATDDGYLSWMLRQDFPKHVKKAIEHCRDLKRRGLDERYFNETVTP